MRTIAAVGANRPANLSTPEFVTDFLTQRLPVDLSFDSNSARLAGPARNSQSSQLNQILSLTRLLSALDQFENSLGTHT